MWIYRLTLILLSIDLLIILSEEEHKEFVEKEVIEHSLETEINNSLILGDMMKYFDLN